VLRCDSERNECATPEEIEEYVRDIEVETFVTNQQLDFLIYGDVEPTVAIQQFWGSRLLDPLYTYTDFLSLAVNEVKTEDAILYLG
jgi:hypothetical protein